MTLLVLSEHPDDQRRTRRQFCASACRLASLAAAGTLASCGGSSPTAPSAPQLSAVAGVVNGRVISVTVDAASPLAAVGSAAILPTSLGTFLLSRAAQDSFSALTATCTHEACVVTGFDGSQFVCPCHGSRYSTVGTVLNGPATRSLQQFPTQFVSPVLTVTV